MATYIQATVCKY